MNTLKAGWPSKRWCVVALAFLSVSALSQVLVPSDWKEMPSSDAGRTNFLNIKTIVRDGAYRKAWVMSTWDTGQSVASLKYMSVLQADLHDCQRRVYATTVMTLYEGALLSGSVARDINVKATDLRWEEIPPSTPADAIHTRVCQ